MNAERPGSSLTLLLALAACLAGCSAPPAPGGWSASDEEAARQPSLDFAAAVARGDAPAAAATYTEDAIALPPGTEGPLRGREAIQKYWQAMIDQGLKDAALTPLAVWGSGDAAHEAGTFALGIQPPGSGAPQRVSGKYVVALKRQPDGTYKVAVDIWNFDAPPAPTASPAHSSR